MYKNNTIVASYYDFRLIQIKKHDCCSREILNFILIKCVSVPEFLVACKRRNDVRNCTLFLYLQTCVRAVGCQTVR